MRGKDDKNVMVSGTEEQPEYSIERPLFRTVQSAGEAEEHLRVIRQAMERSTRHSTLSGLSGVFVGLLSLLGCFTSQHIVPPTAAPLENLQFVGTWGLIVLLSFTVDFVLVKRRAVRVGKTASSPLAKHLARAAAPGSAAALAISLFFVVHPELIGGYIYGIWMLCYAVALLAVGMFSVKEVSVLGWAFLIAGTVTLMLPFGWWIGPRGMMAITFGGFHILYGIWMACKYGW